MLNMLKKFLSQNWSVLVLLFVGVLILSVNLNKPFWGHHDWNGAYWGNVARNFTRHGIFETRLGMIYNVGPATPDNFAYTFHFSPLYPLLLSLFFRLFGISEVTARSLSIILSVTTLFVFYRLIKVFSQNRVALAAIAFWVATPMFIYFGKMPVHDILILLLSITSFLFFFTGRKKLSVLFALLAQLSGWPGYSVVVALTAVIAVGKKGSWREKFFQALSYWATTFAVFGSLLLHDRLLTGSFFGGGLDEIFFTRIRPVAILPYIGILSRWSLTYFTPLILFFAASGLILIISKRIKDWKIPFCLLIYASIYPIISRDSASRHDYLLIYFLPVLTLLASLLLDRFIKRNVLFYGAIILTIMIMVKTRLPYIMALNNSDIYRESALLGKFVNQNSRPNDRVLIVLADKNIPFDGWHISYYADRNLVISPVVPISSKEKYQLKFTYLAPGNITREIFSNANDKPALSD